MKKTILNLKNKVVGDIDLDEVRQAEQKGSWWD